MSWRKEVLSLSDTVPWPCHCHVLEKGGPQLE
jgi:hypothetical protein